MKFHISNILGKWVLQNPWWGAVYYLDSFERAVCFMDILRGIDQLSPRFPLLRQQFADSMRYGTS